MGSTIHRRSFLKTVTATGLALGTGAFPIRSLATHPHLMGKRIGIIGLDTSHSVAFTKLLNGEAPDPALLGYRVTCAYPFGSLAIASGAERIPRFTEDIQGLGVRICGSIAELLDEVDAVMLETNDGRMHYEQALPVIQAGKPLFIDKPLAASSLDGQRILALAKEHRVPVFSASALRYVEGVEELGPGGAVGEVVGAHTFSPAVYEPSHPDLFWYGIHGVELLYAAMGTGCETVQRYHDEYTDVVIGSWVGGRTGVFRGTRSGADRFGGTVFGTEGTVNLGGFEGYLPLVKRITRFFDEKCSPVTPAEMLEVLAFMEAADESKRLAGQPVQVARPAF